MTTTGVCPKDMDALLKAVAELHQEVWKMSDEYQDQCYEANDENSTLQARIHELEKENQELRERLGKYEKPEEKVVVEMAVCSDCGDHRPLHERIQVSQSKCYEFCEDCFQDISKKRMENILRHAKEYEEKSSSETLEYHPSSEEEVETEPEPEPAPEPAPVPVIVTSAGTDYKPLILQNAERLGFNLNVNHVNYLNNYMNGNGSQYNGLINNLDERRFIEWLQCAFQEEMEKIMRNALELDSVNIPARKWEELWKKKEKAPSCGGVLNIVKIEWDVENSITTPENQKKITFKFCGENNLNNTTNVLFKQYFYKERIQ
jgi:hypothetical protein